MKYDKIIIGAGIYGLYSALFCAKNNEKIIVLEKDPEAFKRATYINQARVHIIILAVLTEFGKHKPTMVIISTIKTENS